MKKLGFPALIAVILLVALVFSACSSPKQTTSNEGFAIYLTKEDIPVPQMPVLSHVDIAAAPIISPDDIITYYWDNHTLKLTKEAYDRLIQLQVPTQGTSFLVCVNKAPLYWGAFWTPVSSQSFNGPVIMVPPFPPGGLPGNSIRIEKGYPGEDYYQGTDPRFDPIIMQALEQAGKLR